MARFNRNLRPINTEKKEITWSNLVQDASSTQTITLFEGVPSADVNTATEVEVGSRVNWIYLEFHFSANVVTNPKVIHWQIIFIPEGMTVGAPSSYNQGNKSYIIKRGMEMLPKDLGTVYKRIFTVKVPKKYQRIAVNTDCVLQYISTSSEAINACGIAIYKAVK